MGGELLTPRGSSGDIEHRRLLPCGMERAFGHAAILQGERDALRIASA
jgi:hypothetical protein